ncbi:MAG: HlyD family efflux transporter periplasmic adaptor subunit [Myxococcota bacterium]|nr:HlyD family efflux transporter periplasmic adaptor subunit [Myxococcota bacterium]
MAETLFSGSWYRVKNLTPRLRPHARVHRQIYRGETWYVLQDPSRDRFHRFTPSANHVIGLMDGRRTSEEIWRLALQRLGDEAPTQDEMIRLLGQLHAADLLQSDVPPDARELFRRGRKQAHRQLRSRLLSPFAIKLPLVDPERFLASTVHLVRPLFGWAGALLWLTVVLPAVVLAAVHWSALTENVLDYLFTPSNLLVLWLVFVVLKVFHELGHGFAAKAFGGEVHDMGVMFLVFTPVPYVDASSSWAFPSKYQRALVAAGGMVAELFVAALAFYVWLGAEPGTLRALAYNVLIVGGVTTLLFNANPLLRFDGYYILSDLAEIPNLRQRANQYLGYLVERHAFGNEEADPPHRAPGEPPWLVGYCVAAFLYRIVIVVSILFWALDRFFVLGILLGCVAGIGWVGMPIFRGLRVLFTGPRLRRVRTRAVAVSGAALAVVLLALLAIPMPLRTRAEGVVWIPEEALVRARNAGFVSAVVQHTGDRVQSGEIVLQLADPEHDNLLRVLEHRVAELMARREAYRADDPVAARVTEQELVFAREELAEARLLSEEFAVRAATSGTLLVPREQDLAGRFVRKGDLLAHVVDLDTVTVRAVVSQDDVHLVRERTNEVVVRLSEKLGETHPAEIRRIVPAASERLPSAALGRSGGGEVPVDPTDPRGHRAVERLFEVELVLPSSRQRVNLGGRVYVRFDHGTEPLGTQWYRRLRQLFLSRFHV